MHKVHERAVRDLPCFEFRTVVLIELQRVRSPDCGVKAEKVNQLPSGAPYSTRFQEAVGKACESPSARQVVRGMGLTESTVRTIDLRYPEWWDAEWRRAPLRRPASTCRWLSGSWVPWERWVRPTSQSPHRHGELSNHAAGWPQGVLG